MKRILCFLLVLFLTGIASAEIGVPQNPAWKQGSTATAVWTAVEGADYYLVNVQVFHGDEALGSIETGTSDTEVDLQQEINRVIPHGSYTRVQVAYTVKAGVYDETEGVSYGPESALSPLLEYEFAMVQLSAPTDIRLNPDGTAHWTGVHGAEYYSVFVDISSSGDRFANNSTQTFVSGDVDADGLVSCDVRELFDLLYREAGLYNGELAQFRIRVQSINDDTDRYVNSEFSEASNAVEYATGRLIKLETPQDIVLKPDGTAQWPDIYGADYYSVFVNISSSGDKYANNSTQSFVSGLADASGMFSCDVRKLFDLLYNEAGLYNGESARFWIQVQAMSRDTQKYTDSEWSEASNVVEYAKEALIRLEAPLNVLLRSDGTAQWPGVPHADYYSVSISISSTGDRFANNSTQTFVYGDLDADGMFNCNLKELCDLLYNEAGLYNGELAKFWLLVQSMSNDTDRYVNSVYSAPSNIVEYALREQVRSIVLSPSAPVLYTGNSFYLGKTIQPENAYYSRIDWRSSDASVVATDASGRILGVGPGTAQITASIGDVYDSVIVTVYEISSNIEDPEDMEHVTDSAGGIIDDIANNDNPNLGNTDISEENLDDVRQDVQEGIWRGDAFFTDITWYEENFGRYSDNWGQIQNAARELNAQFAGAYNIEVEMYHKDDAGNDYHIGNIVQLEDEVTFTFDLPTGMDEIESGYTRRYVLVRIHRNTFEAIDVEVGDGCFSAASDCFSDFVLLYVDTPADAVDLSGYKKLVLPSTVRVISAEAFIGTSPEVVVVPKNCERIESRAFANCTELKYIVIPPEAQVEIAEDAFVGSDASVLYQ